MSFEAQLIKGVTSTLTLEAFDNTANLVIANAAAVVFNQIPIANVTTIQGNADITLNPGGNVSISSKYLDNASGVSLVATAHSTESGLLRGNAAGVYYADGANAGGSIRLARSLREAYGTTAQDANIAVTTFPVRISDTTGSGSLLTVKDVSGANVMDISNTSVLINRNVTQTGNVNVTGDLRVAGNMAVTGNITTINSTQVNISDSTLLVNAGYRTVAGKTGGLAINYLPTANSATVATATFAPGVPATSNPILSGLPALQAWAVDGKVIQVSGSASNDGIYEVLSGNATAVVIRGLGVTGNSANLQDVAANQFLTETATNVDVREINLSVLRANSTNGVLQTAQGSASSLLAYRNIGNVSFTGTAPLATAIPVFTDVSGGNISASNVLVVGGNLTASNITANLISTTASANSSVYSASTAAGPVATKGLYNGQTTTNAYTTIGIIPINRANAAVMVSALVIGKNIATGSSLSARIDAGALSGIGPGNVLTLSAAPTKSLFRSAGTSGNYNVDISVSGTTILLQARGQTGETVQWNAAVDYAFGIFA